ncbi:MAG: hypothetical protein HC902_14725 [Calothrix sp. SM1_5_4]|nr:hypothetical protein [Calothrix sp. SM1_5_4]
MTMKAGEVYYMNAVRPGDWVMIWVHDDQEHIDKIIRGIKGFPAEFHHTTSTPA